MVETKKLIANTSVFVGLYISLQTIANLGGFKALDQYLIHNYDIVQATVMWTFVALIGYSLYAIVRGIRSGTASWKDVSGLVHEAITLIPNVDEHSVENYQKQLADSILGKKGQKALAKTQQVQEWARDHGIKINPIIKSCDQKQNAMDYITIFGVTYVNYPAPLNLYHELLQSMQSSKQNSSSGKINAMVTLRNPLPIIPIRPVKSAGYQSLRDYNIKTLILAIVFLIASAGATYLLSKGIWVLG